MPVQQPTTRGQFEAFLMLFCMFALKTDWAINCIHDDNIIIPTQLCFEHEHVTLKTDYFTPVIIHSRRKWGLETMDAYKSDILTQSVEIALANGNSQIPESLFVAQWMSNLDIAQRQRER